MEDERTSLLKASTSTHDSSASINWSHQRISQTHLPTTSNEEYVTYKRRWYLLALFTALAGSQTLLFNTWGSIADTSLFEAFEVHYVFKSSKPVLGWDDGDIALLTAWGPLTMCVSMVFFSWMMDVKGLRVAIVCSSTFVMVGAGIRCIPVPTEFMKWSMNIGQIFNGLGGSVLVAGPPLFSATWFPPHQRTTSTGILASIGYLGLAVSFLLGPAIVSEYRCVDSASILPVTEPYGIISSCDDKHPNMTETVKSEHIHEIYCLMYIEFAWVAFLCLLSWVYFPAKPPTPPSASAEVKREDFIPGAKLLAVNKHFGIPALCYCIWAGFFNAWRTQIDTIFLNTMNVHQGTTGWIAAYSNLAGVVGGISFSSIVDIIGGKIKLVLLCVSSAAVGCFTWYILLALSVIPFNLASLYASNILFAFLINGTPPIYFELIVEGVYPVSEGIAMGLLIWSRALTGLVFLLVMMVPDIGVMWTNWALLGAVSLCIPVLLIYKEKYSRLSMDTWHQPDSAS